MKVGGGIMYEWLKDLITNLWKWLLGLWVVTYEIFHWLFHPTAAWNAAWSMFALAFITKMVQMSYEEGSFWKMLRTRFSVSVAISKAAPRVIFYLVLMFAAARGMNALPETVSNNLHFVFTSFVFVIEFLNSLQHINKIPGVDAGGIISWVKKTLMPKGLDD